MKAVRVAVGSRGEHFKGARTHTPETESTNVCDTERGKQLHECILDIFTIASAMRAHTSQLQHFQLHNAIILFTHQLDMRSI